MGARKISFLAAMVMLAALAISMGVYAVASSEEDERAGSLAEAETGASGIFADLGLACPPGSEALVVHPFGMVKGHGSASPDEALRKALEMMQPELVGVETRSASDAAGNQVFVTIVGPQDEPIAQAEFAEREREWFLSSFRSCQVDDKDND